MMKSFRVIFCLSIILILPALAQDFRQETVFPDPINTAPLLNTLSYDPLVETIIDQTNLDSLITYVRILSGEDSVWIDGSKLRIQHRKNELGNDLAADYVKGKLESYNLEVYDQSYSADGRNIYAIQTGYLYPEEQYIICAHYDAVDDYCADDNASGVAAVLESARILSQFAFKYSLVYALWDEEEIGLLGSQYYVSQADSDQTDIQGVLNIDMIGWDGNDDQLIDIHTRSVANSNILANTLIIVDALYNIPLEPVIYNPGTRQSDHSSFWNYNYGAVLLIEDFYGEDLNPYYHSNDDRIDKFDLSYFHNSSRLAIGAISTLIEVTDDTLIVTVSPEKGYQTYTMEILIKVVHTSFMENHETLNVWLSQDLEIIQADSIVVQSNTSLTAFFYIPMRASTGLWDVNVETGIDGVLSKENCFEILPTPPIISVSRDSLNIFVEPGATVSHSLTIYNNGGSDLKFNILNQNQNYALKFDGINDFVEIPRSITFSEITFSAWLNIRDIDINNRRIFTIDDGEDPDYHYFDIEGGSDQNNLVVYIDENEIIAKDWSYIPYSWTHIAVTYDGSNVKIYSDGILFKTGVINASPRTGILYIGGVNNPSDFAQIWDGTIDEVRVWNRVLTLQEIQANMHNNLSGSELGLTAYWNFNEATGDTAYDLSTNCNHGTLQNGVIWVPYGVSVEPKWLSIEPDTGICAAGSSVEIIMHFDASELDPGEYSGLLNLLSNDPFSPIVNIQIYMSITGTTSIVQNLTLPKEFMLNQNYPNPFNPKTIINYELPITNYVDLSIYNILGQKVATLVSQKQSAGYHEVEFNGQNLSSGIYLYKIEAGSRQVVRKMVLLK